MTSPVVSIIIPTFEHLEDCLKPCLESIIRFTDLKDKEVIIVANGCKDGTVEYVTNLQLTYPSIKLMVIPEAVGYTHATNIGISISRGDYIVFLNNDTVLLPQETDTWINMLKIPFTEDPKVGLTGPLKLTVDGKNVEFIVFFAAMTTRDVIDDIGCLDEIFSPGGCEDMDFAVRLQKAGYKIAVAGQDMKLQESGNAFTGTFPIYHKGEGTFDHIPSYKQSFVDNIHKLHRKHIW